MTPPPTPEDEPILAVLHRRDGLATTVQLTDSKVVVVFNIAWGYDTGDAYSHVTTNISPTVEGAAIDYFYTSEIARLVDPSTDEVLYERV
jgi:hypothetical protein